MSSRISFIKRFGDKVKLDPDYFIRQRDPNDLTELSFPENHHLLTREHLDKMFALPYRSIKEGMLSHPLVTEDDQIEHSEFLDAADIKTQHVHDTVLAKLHKESQGPLASTMDARLRTYKFLCHTKFLTKEQFDTYTPTYKGPLKENPNISSEWKNEI